MGDLAGRCQQTFQPHFSHDYVCTSVMQTCTTEGIGRKGMQTRRSGACPGKTRGHYIVPCMKSAQHLKLEITNSS